VCERAREHERARDESVAGQLGRFKKTYLHAFVHGRDHSSVGMSRHGRKNHDF